MTRGTPDGIFTWRSLVCAAVPPRDPNEDEDEHTIRRTTAKTTITSRPLSESQTKNSQPTSHAGRPT